MRSPPRSVIHTRPIFSTSTYSGLAYLRLGTYQSCWPTVKVFISSALERHVRLIPVGRLGQRIRVLFGILVMVFQPIEAEAMQPPCLFGEPLLDPHLPVSCSFGWRAGL